MSAVTVKNYKGVEIKKIASTSSPEVMEEKMKEAAIGKIVESNDIEVPQELVDEEVRMMIYEHHYRMKYESMASGGYYDFMHEDKARLLEDFKAEALKLIKTQIIIKGIIESENLKITAEELAAEAEAISARQHLSIDMVTDFLGEDLQPLEKDLLTRKAIDFVYSNAVIK